MTDVDNISATKANLELLIMENKTLLDQFSGLVKKLEDMEELGTVDKHVKFHELEIEGAFKFHGVDIRRFQQGERRALPPPQFLRRTRRRMRNTYAMIGEFLSRELFEEGGEALRAEILKITDAKIDPEETAKVLAFKRQVDDLRTSSAFQAYSEVRNEFLQNDEELQTEAKIMAYKEAADDGEMSAQARQDELEAIESKLAGGEITPDEAEELMAALEGGSDEEAAEPETEEGGSEILEAGVGTQERFESSLTSPGDSGEEEEADEFGKEIAGAAADAGEEGNGEEEAAAEPSGEEESAGETSSEK